MTMALVAGEREERGGEREGGERRGEGRESGGGDGREREREGKSITCVQTYIRTTCTCVDRAQH